MYHHEPATLTRDCPAVAIPSGESVTLPAGSSVMITQSLGGTYTVMTNLGQLARIDGSNADAIGKESVADPAERPAEGGAMTTTRVEQVVWDLLRTCYDPEIPVNIVDLGLIYDCGISPLPDGNHRVDVKMTLTAPGCGMGSVLKVDIESRVLGIPSVTEAEVELVMDPPWDPSRMSEAAKLELGMM